MTLDQLLYQQEKLDELFMANSPDVSEKERLTSNILALMVETSEMANEIRSFKYWSKKERSPDDVILEEFVDVLHFYLSIANQLGFTAEDIERAYNRKHDINIERQLSGY
jgi:dimeric dUTPase (all-alpha-NTP-PPase superfamily)